ncbi:MAG: SDR family oxidoreductase [Thermodesulfobacteriota bacterium]
MRSSPFHIQNRRERRKTRFLVTGATGFLGSHILAELLRQGHAVVALCRPKGNLSGSARMNQLLDWFGLETGRRTRLTVLEGCLDRPDLGLSEQAIRRLHSDIHEIIHCAAETRFSSRRRSESERVNLTGLEHVLGLAESGECDFFHHLSTAYAAGKRSGVCFEDLTDTADFYNVYEETKHRGERLAVRRCKKTGIRLNIYRPSIVYGDADTGRSIRFNALYYPIKVAHFLRNLYADDLSNGGKKAAAMGVKAGPNGRIHLPIRIEDADRDGGLHLLPVNYFTRVFIHLMMNELEGDIFHISGAEPIPLARVIAYSRRFLNLSGLEPAPSEDFSTFPRNGLELLFQSYTKAYRPYMQDTRRFSTQKTAALLKGTGICCPAFDYSVFERCMKYAVSVDWGKRLFPAPVDWYRIKNREPGESA